MPIWDEVRAYSKMDDTRTRENMVIHMTKKCRMQQ